MKLRAVTNHALRRIKEEMDLMSTARIWKLKLRTLRPDQPFHYLRILPCRYTVFGVIGQSNQKLGVSARWLAAFLLWLACASAAAQGMYKCADAAGKITYSGKECHLIGQTDAGPVTGRASVAPAIKVPPPARAPAPTAAQPPATASQSPVKDKETEDPESRCFKVSSVVKTAKGFTTVTSTRCKGQPGEDDAASK